MSVYTELSEAFNDGGLRAVLSSGQAVVFHQLAIMSKDGDWILLEDKDSLRHVLSVLGRRQARYRFGAPLDLRWMRGGWSSHFEFRTASIRVRTDFVTRPPRLTPTALADLWEAQQGEPFPVIGVRDLCEVKKTNREKDYAVIGELARLLDNPSAEMLYSRSARDLTRLAEQHPDLIGKLSSERPILAKIAEGIEALESAMDAERRRLIHANEDRLGIYVGAAAGWREAWPRVVAETEGLPLEKAHALIVSRAEEILPFAPAGEVTP
jgi:hypothetical protein